MVSGRKADTCVSPEDSAYNQSKGASFSCALVALVGSRDGEEIFVFDNPVYYATLCNDIATRKGESSCATFLYNEVPLL